MKIPLKSLSSSFLFSHSRSQALPRPSCVLGCLSCALVWVFPCGFRRVVTRYAMPCHALSGFVSCLVLVCFIFVSSCLVMYLLSCVVLYCVALCYLVLSCLGLCCFLCCVVLSRLVFSRSCLVWCFFLSCLQKTSEGWWGLSFFFYLLSFSFSLYHFIFLVLFLVFVLRFLWCYYFFFCFISRHFLPLLFSPPFRFSTFRFCSFLLTTFCFLSRLISFSTF